MVQDVDSPLHFGKNNLTSAEDDCFWDDWVTIRGSVFVVNPRSSAYWDPQALGMGGLSSSLMLVRSKFSSGSSTSWDAGGALTVPVVPSRKRRGGGGNEQDAAGLHQVWAKIDPEARRGHQGAWLEGCSWWEGLDGVCCAKFWRFEGASLSRGSE